jgi:DNA-binding NarL/FixJ family response regulator
MLFTANQWRKTLGLGLRIILADDHVIFRDGIKMLLSMVPGYQVVAEASNANELKQLVQANEPDLVMLDYHIPDGDSTAALAYIKQRYPQTKVVMLTAAQSGAVLQQLSDAGADGILLKEGSAEDMLSAIRRVVAGERVITPKARERMQNAAVDLTPREFQVLHLICEGHSSADISERFSLSVRTVDKHRENILRKFGVNNAAQLVSRTRELGLFS